MVQTRRRVSYVIPPPTEPVPRLQLPPYGASRIGAGHPLLMPMPGQNLLTPAEEQPPVWARHPRHRLGVASLAIDTTTQLSGREAPEGILYSGGRDGLVMSWDLGLPLKRRKIREGEGRFTSRWEIMTGWMEDGMDEEDEEDEVLPSDGDILGEVAVSPHRRRHRPSRSAELRPEEQWEMDVGSFVPGTSSEFRQCSMTHTDWVNDILLCNQNQTVVSASSDGTVKAWAPHAANGVDPSTIGSHTDYVRCLTSCREQNWVASGSFDRTIKLWDLNRTSSNPEPISTLNPPDATAPKSSVYALAADPFGHTVASGSPERVIRLWDPRTGKRTGKLVGHTDNIRAILISDDSKYLLTGSADASIKLWSLTSQRCLHTFTYNTESVWSLHSSHPSLEVFYSGDRSGLVCKVDVENCTDVAEGECVVLCQDAGDHGRTASEGINKIIALDDSLVWTASGHSSIKRWGAPSRRADRATSLPIDADGDRSVYNSPTAKPKWNESVASEANTRPSTGHGPRSSLTPSLQTMTSVSDLLQRDREAKSTLYGIPFESLVLLASPNDPFSSFNSSRGRDPEVATLYSAASIISVPRGNTNSKPSVQAIFQSSASAKNFMPSSRTEDTVLPTNTAQAEYEQRELASDAIPLFTAPDEVIAGEHGLVRCIILNDRIHALTVDTAGEVAVWDITRALCVGKYVPEDIAAASVNGSTTGGSSNGERERSPREALETVRERIEGEAVVSQWSNADTKAGVLAIHLNEKCFDAEVYADEVGFLHDQNVNDETKLNLGKWVLRNLFIGFIREEQRLQKNRDGGVASPNPTRGPFGPDSSPKRRPSHSPDSPRKTPRPFVTGTVISSPKMIPATVPVLIPLPRSSPLIAPLIPLFAAGYSQSPSSAQYSPGVQPDSPSITKRQRSGTVDSGYYPPPSLVTSDDALARARKPSLSTLLPTPSDDFSGWSGPQKTDNAPATPNTPSGLMGRLKSFGKMSKRPVSDTPGTQVATSLVAATEVRSEVEQGTPRPSDVKSPVQTLLSTTFNPPSSLELPNQPFPPNVTLLISQEASPGYTTLYRGSVSTTASDVAALEETMPLWLLEYLLLNKTAPPPPLIKLSFVLLPYPNKHGEQLPELLNTAQSKLTASRYLRVRKLVTHVQEKLDKGPSTPRPGSSHSSTRVSSVQDANKPRAEDVYEVLCNDVALPLDMTLAAVRQYIWRQSSELTMHYRKKVTVQSATNTAPTAF